MKPTKNDGKAMGLSNPLEALALSKNGSAQKDALSPLGLDTSKPVACLHILQAVQLEKLMEDGLFPVCDIEIVSEDLSLALRLLDGDSVIKQEQSRYCALVCNARALERLGEEDRIRAIFTLEEMIPTEGRDCKNEEEAQAEAAFLKEITRLFERKGADCEKTFASVYAEGDGEEMSLWAVCFDALCGALCWDWISEATKDAKSLAVTFARQMLNRGLWSDETEGMQGRNNK